MVRFTALMLTGLLLQSCGGVRPKMTLQERCEGYGYKQGTDAFRDCIAQESRTEREMEDARINAIIWGD